jgi:hypothetical protein
MDQEAKDRAVLALLQGSGPETANSDREVAPRVKPPDGEVDALLRSWEMNYHERAKARRRQRKPVDKGRDQDSARKRIRFYLDKRVDAKGTGPDRAQLAAEWAGLANDDVDSVLRWWHAGIDPENPGQLNEAIREGFSPQDLKEVVRGKTIAEHLHDGQSLRWCINALSWGRRHAG